MPDDVSMDRDPLDETADWWRLYVVGVLGLVAGVLVLLRPDHSLVTLSVITGIFVLVDGLVAIAAAVVRRDQSDSVALVLGVLGVVGGAALIRHPIAGITAVAFILGIWLLAAGAVRLVAALDAREHRGRRLAAAAVLIVSGVLIISTPDIGYTTLTLFAGIGLLAYGVAMLALGRVMHGLRRLDERPVTDADAGVVAS